MKLKKSAKEQFAVTHASSICRENPLYFTTMIPFMEQKKSKNNLQLLRLVQFVEKNPHYTIEHYYDSF
jgi:hypothetical protein